MEAKTNAMRSLDKAKIKYNTYSYTPTGSITGAEAVSKSYPDLFRDLATIPSVSASIKV